MIAKCCDWRYLHSSTKVSWMLIVERKTKVFIPDDPGSGNLAIVRDHMKQHVVEFAKDT